MFGVGREVQLSLLGQELDAVVLLVDAQQVELDRPAVPLVLEGEPAGEGGRLRVALAGGESEIELEIPRVSSGGLGGDGVLEGFGRQVAVDGLVEGIRPADSGEKD